MSHVTANQPLTSLPFFSRSMDELVIELTTGGKLQTVATPNPEQIVLAYSNHEFTQILSQIDYLVPDGMGLVLASHLLAKQNKMTSLPARIPGVELASVLIKRYLEFGQPILIVGGRAYAGLYLAIAGRMVEILDVAAMKEVRPSQNQAVYWSPNFTDVTQILTELKPGLVLVALGAPHQEEWILRQKMILERSQVKVAMAVGGAIDILAGKIKRAPRWMRNLGLEWLWRLIQEPWRLKRQLQLIKFVEIVFKELAIESKNS